MRHILCRANAGPSANVAVAVMCHLTGILSKYQELVEPALEIAHMYQSKMWSRLTATQNQCSVWPRVHLYLCPNELHSEWGTYRGGTHGAVKKKKKVNDAAQVSPLQSAENRCHDSLTVVKVHMHFHTQVCTWEDMLLKLVLSPTLEGPRTCHNPAAMFSCLTAPTLRNSLADGEACQHINYIPLKNLRSLRENDDGNCLAGQNMKPSVRSKLHQHCYGVQCRFLT